MYRTLFAWTLITLLGAGHAWAGPDHGYKASKRYHSALHPIGLHPAKRDYNTSVRQHTHAGYPHFTRPFSRTYYRHYRHPVSALLLGSAITYSLIHQHHGSECREGHGYASRHDLARRYNVVGCEQIERYADGSEYREQVSLSHCR